MLRDIMEQITSRWPANWLTVAAVKSRFHRARVHLRDRVNRYFRESCRANRGA